MSTDEKSTNANAEQSNKKSSLPVTTNLEWWVNLPSVLIIGGGIGWLLGLSVSPVVAGIVAVVIAAAATLVAAMGGWQQSEDKSEKTANSSSKNENETATNSENVAILQNADTHQDKQQSKQSDILRFSRIVAPLPFALLMIGIVAGSVVGLYARNHSWFGSNLSYEVEKWTAQGLPKEEVVRRLFEREHPYTPYIQPWLQVTSTLPISSSVSLTVSQIALSNPISAEVGMWEDLGLDRTQVISRFFDLRYPTDTKSQSVNTDPSQFPALPLENPEDQKKLLSSILKPLCDRWKN